MTHSVIDTNVLLVANGAHPDISPAGRAACVRRLLNQQQKGVTVIDDAFQIIKE